jgi:hypothetical protein
MEPNKIEAGGLFCNAAKRFAATLREKQCAEPLPSILKMGSI